MSDKSDLLAAIGELENMLGQSANLGEKQSEDWRRGGIQMRRMIAARVAAIRCLGEKAFDLPAERDEFLRQFSAMRSAMAFHQASWPVVAVDVSDPAYKKSLQSSRDANLAFIRWVRSRLGTPISDGSSGTASTS